MIKWFINGNEAAAISPDDRGLSYGDGLFETIALRHGKPRFLNRHLARLQAGCQRLAIPAPDARLIEQQIHDLAAGSSRGTIKLVLTRGCGPRGYGPPLRPSPTLAIGFTPDDLLPGSPTGEGWALILCTVPASFNPRLAGLKTLNRLDNVMARAECLARKADEGIMCTPGGHVTGGTMSNLFLVSHGSLLTPVLDEAGICGIMRSMVIEVAEKVGMPVRECRITAEDLVKADELFVTNSLMGVRPVGSFEGRSLGAGPVTGSIMSGLAAAGIEECGA